MIIKNLTVITIIIVLGSLYSFAQMPEGDSFVFSQLMYKGGNWDPYPSMFRELEYFVTTTTSIKFYPEMKNVRLRDDAIFNSPFLYIAGNGEFDELSDEEIEMLRRYLKGGGIIFADDCQSRKNYGFDKSFRREMKRVFPEREFEKIPKDHVIYRSFYLNPKTVGTRDINSYLEGIYVEDRIAIIYSQNDMSGVWARDKLGNWFKKCTPGGETQRLESQKLFVNIIFYALCDTYKKDTIHVPFIKRKLKKR